MRTRRYDVYGDENEQIRYDADGNIESLIRHGPELCTNGALYRVIDDFNPNNPIGDFTLKRYKFCFELLN